MINIRPMAETNDTVTLRRADYEALLNALEDAEDVAAAKAAEARVDSGQSEYLPIDVAERLLAGESPLRVWREHRGISAGALAEAVGISMSYLSAIEGRRRPGSFEVMTRIAKVLGVSLEDLASFRK